MPTYDYVCDACEHKFDAFESIKADPQTKCPECGKKKLRRLFGIGAGIIFKGSGFYQTDYRSEGYKKKAEAEKSSSSESKPADSKPADSKAAETKSESSSASSNGSQKKTDGKKKSKE